MPPAASTAATRWGPAAVTLLAGACGAAALSGALSGGTASAWSGPLVVVSLVVAAAGVAKAVRPHAAARALSAVALPVPPAAVRGLGGVEVAIGAAAAVGGGTAAAWAVAGCYLGFAAVSGALARAGADGCGCFGSADPPPGRLHLWLNLAAAATAGGAAAASAGGLAALVTGTPWAGFPAVLGCSVGAGLLIATYTVVPDTLAAASRPERTDPPTFALTEEVAR
jgi:hypothetical protein